MDGKFRRTLLAAASIVLAGPWLAAGAMPVDEIVVRRSAKVDVPFVPAVDPATVPGFTRKMRGDSIAYCRTEQKIGTRFKAEVCIDQAQMPAYLAARDENRRLAVQFRTGETRIN